MDNYFDQLEDELKEKPINWREIFEKMVTHWKWFVLSVIIAIIAGFFYIRLQQDVYEVKASMLIIAPIYGAVITLMFKAFTQ